MNDEVMAIAALLIELVFPLALVAICITRPAFSRYLTPILGAISPMLIAYAYTAYGYQFRNKEDFGFAYYTMWLMSFFIYCLLIFVGVVLGCILRNRLNNYLRYAIGFTTGPLVSAFFLIIEAM